MGINIPSREELIANQVAMEDLAKHFGADSIQYLSIEGSCHPRPLIKAIGISIVEYVCRFRLPSIPSQLSARSILSLRSLLSEPTRMLYIHFSPLSMSLFAASTDALSVPTGLQTAVNDGVARAEDKNTHCKGRQQPANPMRHSPATNACIVSGSCVTPYGRHWKGRGEHHRVCLLSARVPIFWHVIAATRSPRTKTRSLPDGQLPCPAGLVRRLPVLLNERDSVMTS